MITTNYNSQLWLESFNLMKVFRELRCLIIICVISLASHHHITIDNATQLSLTLFLGDPLDIVSFLIEDFR